MKSPNLFLRFIVVALCLFTGFSVVRHFNSSPETTLQAFAPITTTTPTTTPIRYVDEVFTAFTVETGEYQKGYPYKIFQPTGDTELKRPVIIFYHAGGGTIDDVTGWCQDFVKRGYVTMSAEYNLLPGDGFPKKEQITAINNSWTAVNYMLLNADRYKINVSDIFLGGVSAGALTAVQSSVALNNSTDPFFGTHLPLQPTLKIRASITISGAVSPYCMKFINAGDPPNFAYHGDQDGTIKYSQAVATYNKMISVGIPSNLMTFKGKGHKLESHDEILNDLKNRLYLLL